MNEHIYNNGIRYEDCLQKASLAHNYAQLILNEKQVPTHKQGTNSCKEEDMKFHIGANN